MHIIDMLVEIVLRCTAKGAVCPFACVHERCTVRLVLLAMRMVVLVVSMRLSMLMRQARIDAESRLVMLMWHHELAVVEDIRGCGAACRSRRRCRSSVAVMAMCGMPCLIQCSAASLKVKIPATVRAACTAVPECLHRFVHRRTVGFTFHRGMLTGLTSIGTCHAYLVARWIGADWLTVNWADIGGCHSRGGAVCVWAACSRDGVMVRITAVIEVLNVTVRRKVAYKGIRRRSSTPRRSRRRCCVVARHSMIRLAASSGSSRAVRLRAPCRSDVAVVEDAEVTLVALCTRDARATDAADVSMVLISAAADASVLTGKEDIHQVGIVASAGVHVAMRSSSSMGCHLLALVMGIACCYV